MTCLAYAADNMPLSNVPVAPASLAMELGIVEDTPPNIEPTTNKKPCIRCGCIKKCRCSKRTLRAVAAAEAAWAAAKATGASDAEARSAAGDAEADVLMIPGGRLRRLSTTEAIAALQLQQPRLSLHPVALKMQLPTLPLRPVAVQKMQVPTLLLRPVAPKRKAPRRIIIRRRSQALDFR